MNEWMNEWIISEWKREKYKLSASSNRITVFTSSDWNKIVYAFSKENNCETINTDVFKIELVVSLKGIASAVGSVEDLKYSLINEDRMMGNPICKQAITLVEFKIKWII